jgi:HK97 family phage prohead protease
MSSSKVQEKQAASKPMMYKSFGGELKVDRKSRTVSGYLSAFGNVDSDGEVLAKGCFAKSLQERGVDSPSPRKIAFLYQHDTKRPLGRFTVLKEDDFGLYFEAKISKIPLGDEVLEQYADGTLNQHSIGGKRVWDKAEYDSRLDAIVQKEIKLLEGSVVTAGANENTPFLGMKSEQRESHRNQLLQDFELAVKNLEYESQVELSQLFSKALSLSETEPPERALGGEPPAGALALTKAEGEPKGILAKLASISNQ